MVAVAFVVVAGTREPPSAVETFLIRNLSAPLFATLVTDLNNNRPRPSATSSATHRLKTPAFSLKAISERMEFHFSSLQGLLLIGLFEIERHNLVTFVVILRVQLHQILRNRHRSALRRRY
jgi:hypothetical protein